ncbi:transcription elongation factor GreAB [Rhizobium ruizarguesonis]|jgi:regulator of nucleoside diphosphate kinase|uniref:Transcription elongation factor GreAB n=3 Tax=Rhizobium TaxID=379 RepID=A0ABY1WWJ9_9HYPH|nr:MULTISPECIES: GreA/GreB family elongation factor [Rhizobium]MBY3044214.1 transcription elongation factor GreAB [Rhizobium leguminosarum]QKK18868.1 GreA/GreB family elongation factor [Rhizobium indicum]TAU13085.1 transcription elongation factor GreAB [Rhizobium ruizarguesonis]TAU57636.1 transcription elongation factor GreAB [Rhizobium ruizarguesonis]TAV19097.1 transcription elongation factor GreAB [Rhizobium ruizarguesonis]
MSNSISSSMHHVSILGATDYSSLVRLAKTASAKDRHASAELVDKLEKIVVVPDGQSPDGTVGIGSTVTFDVKGASRRTITLVDPDDLDAEASRISVLAPIGVALLGLRQGQSSQWVSQDGQFNDLTVVHVAERPITGFSH